MGKAPNSAYQSSPPANSPSELYAEPPVPSGVEVLMEYDYVDQQGRGMRNYHVLVPGSTKPEMRTASQVPAVGGGYLWEWGALDVYPLYTSSAMHGSCECADSRVQQYVFVVSNELTVTALDKINCCTVYRGIEGIQRTDWSQVLDKHVVTLCDYTAEGFAFAAQVISKVAAERVKASAACQGKVLDSVPGFRFMDGKDSLFMGKTIMALFHELEQSTGEPYAHFLGGVVDSQDFNTDLKMFAPPAVSDGECHDPAPCLEKKKSKSGISEILAHIFEVDGVKIYSVDVNSRYMLVCAGQHANKTFAPGTQQYREYVQSVLVALGTPCISSIQHSALDRAIRSSALSLVYTDRKSYEYMGNSYCVCNHNLYVNYSDTEVAVFYAGGWRSPEIMPKSTCPVQFRPEPRERLCLPMDAGFTPSLAFREYMDELFSAVPANVRPLIAGYLVMSTIGYKYIKPILSFVGSAGSGKTTAAALFKDVVEQLPSYGWEGYVDQSTPKAIAAYISGNVVSIFDNALTMPKHISAFMAGIVTGKSYTQRTLFTTAEKSTVELNSVLLYTSLVIPTREDDTADRMLVVRFKGRPKMVSAPRADGLMVAHTEAQNRLTPELRRLVCKAAADVLAKEMKGTELLPSYAGERMGLFLTALSVAAQTVGYTDEEVHAAYLETRAHTTPEVEPPPLSTELPSADSLPPLVAPDADVYADSEQAILDVVKDNYLRYGTKFSIVLADLLQDVRARVLRNGGANAPTSGRALRELLKRVRPLLSEHGITFTVGSGWHSVRFEQIMKL